VGTLPDRSAFGAFGQYVRPRICEEPGECGLNRHPRYWCQALPNFGQSGAGNMRRAAAKPPGTAVRSYPPGEIRDGRGFAAGGRPPDATSPTSIRAKSLGARPGDPGRCTVRPGRSRGPRKMLLAPICRRHPIDAAPPSRLRVRSPLRCAPSPEGLCGTPQGE
jgi:hypothetical protein